MDRTERFYKIEHLLTERGVVPVQVFLDALEVSLATFKRDIEYLRSRLHAPIVWDREAGGYRYADSGCHRRSDSRVNWSG
jgi:predicted DNA-binding transcriptional regulator YafY